MTQNRFLSIEMYTAVLVIHNLELHSLVRDGTVKIKDNISLVASNHISKFEQS